MLQFLEDYGLKWVGGDSGPNAPHKSPREGGMQTEEFKEVGPCNRPKLPKEIDTVVLGRRIEELNFIAEKQYITTIEGNMRGFKSHNDVNITFYSNGLQMDSFPFYSYNSRQGKNILGDILDGYFPYDLKTKFPEGVPLKMVDKTAEVWQREGLKT